jgi:type IV fimbrial biogenesis protein FimT
MNGPRNRGFTLLELLVTVAVAAVLLGIGVPSFIDTVRNNQMAASANDLLAAMHLARTEAVKRRTPVTVCSSANPLAAPVCAAGSFNGWVVFADTDGDVIVDSAAVPAEVVLRAHGPLPDTITTLSDSSFVSFAGTGFRRDAGGNPSASAIRLCDGRGNVDAGGGISTARVLQIAATGRPQILRAVADVTAAGDCP